MAAIKEGLLSVVPEAILNLLTWQEIEKKICGDPEISVEGLRKSGQPKFMSSLVFSWHVVSQFYYSLIQTPIKYSN